MKPAPFHASISEEKCGISLFDRMELPPHLHACFHKFSPETPSVALNYSCRSSSRQTRPNSTLAQCERSRIMQQRATNNSLSTWIATWPLSSTSRTRHVVGSCQNWQINKWNLNYVNPSIPKEKKMVQRFLRNGCTLWSVLKCGVVPV